MDHEMTSLDEIARKAWSEGTNIDLEGCYYGKPHWEGDFVHHACSYYYFLAGLVRTQGLTRILEIGTHMGGSISAMYRGIREERLHGARLLTVDVTDLSDAQLHKHPDIRKVCGDALEAEIIQGILSYFHYEPIDLLYIDAVHQYKHTISMMGLYNSLLRPKFIALDDIYLNPSMQKLWYDIMRLFPAHALGLETVSEKIRGYNVGFGLISNDFSIQDYPVLRAEISSMQEQGEECYARGDHDTAALHFLNVLQRDPLNDEALNNLGTLSWERGDVAASLEYFRKAYNLDPHSSTTVLNLTDILTALGQGQEARRIRTLHVLSHPEAEGIFEHSGQ